MGCGQALDLLHYVFWPNKWHIVPLKFEIAVTPKSLMIFPSFLASKIMLTSGTRALFGSCNKPSEAWFRLRTFHEPNLYESENQFIGTPVSIGTAQAVLSAKPGREFRLWNDFGTALIQTTNFSCT